MQTGRPVVSNTAFQAASISKPLTAMAALRLVQEKRFSLDGDINAVLESWHIPVTDLNRTQLLNGQAPSNVKQVLFARPPFQQFKYSGGGLTIMQLALTDLTKRPFAEFMKNTVLDPLGTAHVPPRLFISIQNWPQPDCGRRRVISHSLSSKCKGRVLARKGRCGRPC